jgi:hypothetical protein
MNRNTRNGNARLTTLGSAGPTAGARRARRLSLAGVPYEEVLASMMKTKRPVPAKAGSKVKRAPGKRPAGPLAPGDRKSVADALGL